MIGDEDSQERSDALPAQGALLRRWSPIYIPMVLGAAACLGALTLIVRHVVPPTDLLLSGGPVELLALAVVFGALLGVLLSAATDPRAWAATLLTGGLVYVALIFAVAIGLVLGLAMIGAAALLLFAYVRTHLWLVPDDVVVLIGRRGHFVRVVYPGLNLLWPLERPMGTLPTGLHIYTSPAQQVQRTDPRHTTFRLSASAVVAYAIIPEEAGKAADAPQSWERDLQQIVDAELESALMAWSHHEIAEGGAVPENPVARAVLEATRSGARERGIWVAWVRICHIRVRLVETDPELVAVAPGASAYAAASAGATQPRNARETAHRKARMLGEVLAHHADAAAEDELAHDPAALTDLYESIREGHIKDPETIRGIARSFAEVAASPDLSALCEFNATAAADLLTAYAAKLERYQRENRQSTPSWPTGPGIGWSRVDLRAPTQDLILR